MTITAAQIEELASREGVRRIAVENFLSTLEVCDDLTRLEVISNLNLDARLYHWNANTVKALREGINLHFGAKR
jgi:hypothetical protein